MPDHDDVFEALAILSDGRSKRYTLKQSRAMAAKKLGLPLEMIARIDNDAMRHPKRETLISTVGRNAPKQRKKKPRKGASGGKR